MIEPYWTTAYGQTFKFSELEHQHLSNILWFNEVFNSWTRANNSVQRLLWEELDRRFESNRLTWKPLPIPQEILWIHRYCVIDSKGLIYWHGDYIGEVNHIENWELQIGK